MANYFKVLKEAKEMKREELERRYTNYKTSYDNKVQKQKDSIKKLNGLKDYLYEKDLDKEQLIMALNGIIGELKSK